MRTILLIAVLASVAACSPDIASGSYLCGPEGDCPEGQACNGDDNICVLAGAAKPFSCTAKMPTEPDDTAAQGFVLPNMTCVSVPFVNQNCMLQGDTEDWVAVSGSDGVHGSPGDQRASRFRSRSSGSASSSGTSTRWRRSPRTRRARRKARQATRSAASTSRSTRGVNYGIKTHPAGDGTCDGQCAYNRYTLSVQLATP